MDSQYVSEHDEYYTCLKYGYAQAYVSLDSLDKKPPAINEYLISNVDSEIILNPYYEKINIKLTLYTLYKKKGDISLEKKTIVSGLTPIKPSLAIDENIGK